MASAHYNRTVSPPTFPTTGGRSPLGEGTIEPSITGCVLHAYVVIPRIGDEKESENYRLPLRRSTMAEDTGALEGNATP